MNAKQFRENYARDRNYVDWDEMWDSVHPSNISRLEDKIMSAFASHKIEEIKEKLKGAFYNVHTSSGKELVMIEKEDLDKTFDKTLETLNELK